MAWRAPVVQRPDAMRQILAQTQQLVTDECGVAALAYASSSSLLGMAFAVALDLTLRGRRTLSRPSG